MAFKYRSYHPFAGLFILFLLFASSFLQKGVSAQDGEITPTGLGQPPESGVERALDQGQVYMGLDVAEAKFFTYLPLAIEPSIPSPKSNCDVNGQERTLANLATTNPNQTRSVMDCHPILGQVARARALDMGQKGYFSHTNPDGFGPNYLVVEAGYKLPSSWPNTPDENYIESIAAGYTTAEEAWNAWLNSDSHRTHVLGEINFWAEQTNYGMGYAYIPDSPFGHYWVFITAPPEGSQ